MAHTRKEKITSLDVSRQSGLGTRNPVYTPTAETALDKGMVYLEDAVRTNAIVYSNKGVGQELRRVANQIKSDMNSYLSRHPSGDNSDDDGHPERAPLNSLLRVSRVAPSGHYEDRQAYVVSTRTIADLSRIMAVNARSRTAKGLTSSWEDRGAESGMTYLERVIKKNRIM